MIARVVVDVIAAVVGRTHDTRCWIRLWPTCVRARMGKRGQVGQAKQMLDREADAVLAARPSDGRGNSL